MAIICSVHHNLPDFHWDKKSNTLTAEESLISEGGTFRLYGRVYDDACDEGFYINSPHTGKEVLFVIDHYDMEEGEIVGTWLKPESRLHKDLQYIKLLMIND